MDGLADHVWSVEELIDAAASAEPCDPPEPRLGVRDRSPELPVLGEILLRLTGGLGRRTPHLPAVERGVLS